eukprot:4563062-Pleurochrysis_carterae.AAC.1
MGVLAASDGLATRRLDQRLERLGAQLLAAAHKHSQVLEPSAGVGDGPRRKELVVRQPLLGGAAREHPLT